VPWRQAIRDAIRGLAGNGRTALPERLEGAVYGQLVGAARGSAALTWSDDSARMLSLLDSLLRARPDLADDRAAGPAGREPIEAGWTEGSASASPAGMLPLALVLRAREPGEIVDLAVRAAGPPGEPQVAGALYALLVGRFVAGERGRASVLARATRDLRGALANRDLAQSADHAPRVAALAALDSLLARSGRKGGNPAIDGFWSGWEAFADSGGYQEAVTCAPAFGSAAHTPRTIAGGLAGAYWGSSGIPVAWRRALPAEPVVRWLVDRLIETDAPGWDGRPWRTSTSSPLRVDPLDLSGIAVGGSGAVGITFLPGRRYVGYHTGAHWRDLETDAARLHELGVDVLLLLVEDRELVRCRVTPIGEALAAHDVRLVRFPIRDPLLPRDGLSFRRTLGSLLQRVREGGSLAIACRGGLDRAGMTAACLLREAGLGANEAIDRVQRARPGALTLPDQQGYVRAWPPHR
jgi:ADP-ribosylglycohydrolase